MQSSIMCIILFRCKDVEMTTPSKITQKIILFSPKYTFLKTLFKYDIYRSNINDFFCSQGAIKTNQKTFCWLLCCVGSVISGADPDLLEE